MKNLCNYSLLLLLLTAVVPTWGQGVHIRYSPADSILYMAIPGTGTFPFGRQVLLRFHDGGRRISSASQGAPWGQISTTDGIPGHLYIMATIEGIQYRSTDYGESWITAPNVPGYFWEEQGDDNGRGGVEPGHSVLYRRFNPPLLFYTSDCWDTYDTVATSFDSVSFSSLCFDLGILYGRSPGTSYLCVSSDTGRTWATNQSEFVGVAGKVDELWGFSNFTYSVALDTGRTIIDSILITHPPSRYPFEWERSRTPTNNPGEAYNIALIRYTSEPRSAEILVYHMQDYGATMDSTLYFLPNYQIGVSERPNTLPTNYSIAAYPNPFNSSVTIRYSLPKAGEATIAVYDVTGRIVETLSKGYVPTGNGTIRWRPGNISSGTYFIRLQAGGTESTTLTMYMK